MALYDGKDIDRVCRASGMSRAQAEVLLRQCDGRPDRVLVEKCGAVRVYAEPERVAEPESGFRAAWQRAADLLAGAWQRVADAGRRLTAAPILLAILPALAALLRKMSL